MVPGSSDLPRDFSISTTLDAPTGAYRGSGEPPERTTIEQLWRRSLGPLGVLLAFWGLCFTSGAVALLMESPSIVWLERFRLVLDVEQEEHVLFDHLGSFEAALAVRARLMTAVNTHRE